MLLLFCLGALMHWLVPTVQVQFVDIISDSIQCVLCVVTAVNCFTMDDFSKEIRTIWTTPLLSPFKEGQGVSAWQNFGIKDACR